VATVISIGRSHLIEEDLVISQERASHPAAGEQQEDVQDRGQPCDSSLDSPCGASFDYIDEALEETMIASDPPALTPQTGSGAPAHGAGQDRARRD
jgi:hypothetical protein